MLALLDGDIVAYRCAATAQQDPDWVATSRCNTLIEQILNDVGAKEYKVFLSGPINFRKQIYPAYKANRTQPAPIHLATCKKFIEERWGGIWTDGYEADDALGIAQHTDEFMVSNDEPIGFKTIICSIDKDLKQIPGRHYNFVKKEFDTITVHQGLLNFYSQVLIGDATDNVKGCPGIGKAKAPRILAGCETEQAMFDAVRDAYNDDENMYLNAQLLYILREENQYWNPEKFIKPEPEVQSDSTQPMQEENIQFTAHGGTLSKTNG